MAGVGRSTTRPGRLTGTGGQKSCQADADERPELFAPWPCKAKCVDADRPFAGRGYSLMTGRLYTIARGCDERSAALRGRAVSAAPSAVAWGVNSPLVQQCVPEKPLFPAPSLHIMKSRVKPCRADALNAHLQHRRARRPIPMEPTP